MSGSAWFGGAKHGGGGIGQTEEVEASGTKQTWEQVQ